MSAHGERRSEKRHIVAIGSNIEPEHNVPLAVTCLCHAFHVVDVSRFYQTDPVGPPGQPDYWNGAVIIQTGLDRVTLVRALRDIEHDLGRRRSDDRYAPRTVDLDLMDDARPAGSRSADRHIPPHLALPLRDLGID